MSQTQPCIAVVLYDRLEKLPPVMTLLTVLKGLSVPLHFIGRATEPARQFLTKENVSFDFIEYPEHPTRLSRALTFFPRRRKLLAVLDRLQQQHGAVVPWFQEVHSAAWAGDAALRYKHCITTQYEFGCTYGSRWIGFDLAKMLKNHTLVECEINRAYLAQSLYGLAERPLVLTNKPIINSETVAPLNDEAKAVFAKIGTRPVFLYQGNLSAVGGERGDVPMILETIAKNRPEYCVLSMPANDYICNLLRPYPNAFTLSHIPAPGHLAVTAKATVGIAVYRGGARGMWGVNATYCAPNKTYEYAAFGLPTLANDIPGLIYSIGAAKAGVCCEVTSEKVLTAADELITNLSNYQANARKFYADTDTVAEIRAILRHV